MSTDVENDTPRPKLSDMGTTGLINYVASQLPGRRFALALANASRVIQKRYRDGRVVSKFQRACYKAQDKVLHG